MYGASEGLATVVLDAVAVGGQAATTSRIENYLGFPSGISGPELAERGTIQAEKFGAEINVPCATTGLEQRDGQYVVRYDDAKRVSTRALVIATGARYRKLDVPRLEDFEGAGVYYAATQMEAMMCRGDPVVVVGGGNSAGQATLFMSRQAPMVRLVIRHDDLARDMSRYLVDRIARTPNVEVLACTEVRELVGDSALEALVVADLRTGEQRRIEARALFVFIGADPHTGWLGGQVELDETGSSSPARAPCRAPSTVSSRRCSRPACQACSRRATCAADRSSAWPPPSARARWPCSSCTPTSTGAARSPGLDPTARRLIERFGCREPPARSRSMTQLMTEQGMVKVPAGTWKVDQAHSSVAFEVKHMMISTVRGLLSEYRRHARGPGGSRTVDGDGLGRGGVDRHRQCGPRRAPARA